MFSFLFDVVSFLFPSALHLKLAFHIFSYQMTYSELSDVLLEAIKPENRSHVQFYYEP